MNLDSDIEIAIVCGGFVVKRMVGANADTQAEDSHLRAFSKPVSVVSDIESLLSLIRRIVDTKTTDILFDPTRNEDGSYTLDPPKP